MLSLGYRIKLKIVMLDVYKQFLVIGKKRETASLRIPGAILTQCNGDKEYNICALNGVVLERSMIQLNLKKTQRHNIETVIHTSGIGHSLYHNDKYNFERELCILILKEENYKNEFK